VQVGTNVESVKTGDRLAGTVHGGKFKNQGAFSEYTIADPLVSFKLPEHISYEEGASLGVPLFTAAQALYHRLELPEPSLRSGNGKAVLIWSAATAVGIHAVQLAKLSGLTVYATASPSNFEYLKSIGADHLFDYNEADVGQKIREAAGDSLAHGLDCISTEQTVTSALTAFGRGGGQLVTLLAFQKASPRPEVKVTLTLLYTALGKEVELRGTTFPASPQDRAFHERWERIVGEDLLVNNKIQFMPIEKRQGLESIDGIFKDVIDGKNRRLKYIVTL